jgi:hypothetical protein
MFEHRRTARLPFGFACTFLFRGNIGMHVEWLPRTPLETDMGQRAKNRFIRAYDEARREFLTEVATMTGEPVMVVDFSGGEPVGDVVTIEPAVRH